MSDVTPHWFADIDEESHDFWQPCFETGTGHIPCLDVWFQTEAECEEWIRRYVIGAPLNVEDDK